MALELINKVLFNTHAEALIFIGVRMVIIVLYSPIQTQDRTAWNIVVKDNI